MKEVCPTLKSFRNIKPRTVLAQMEQNVGETEVLETFLHTALKCNNRSKILRKSRSIIMQSDKIKVGSTD